MQIRMNPSWDHRHAVGGAEPAIGGFGGASQAAGLWRVTRGRPRPSGGPSKAILARADQLTDMLRRLKEDVHGPDNATKAAHLSLLV